MYLEEDTFVIVSRNDGRLLQQLETPYQQNGGPDPNAETETATAVSVLSSASRLFKQTQNST